jgi:hypothetical protein
MRDVIEDVDPADEDRTTEVDCGHAVDRDLQYNNGDTISTLIEALEDRDIGK